ncbi:Helix-turn-helix motif protein [Raphanus sativus]|nr:Helix-turn-helix motif protein [Raphanus sativus]
MAAPPPLFESSCQLLLLGSHFSGNQISIGFGVSGGDGGGGGGGGGRQHHDGTETDRKKKHYHRHTAQQIQRLESSFKEYPHPDDKQRNQISRELGLAPRQIKFWFQNRRTQLKAQHERHITMH